MGALVAIRFCFERLKKRPRNFLRASGVSLEDFSHLVTKCQPKWLSKVVSAKQIEGRPYGVVDLENHILVLLIYYRCYITQEFIGMLYGTADSSICRTIQRIEPILASVVAIKKDRTLSKKELETNIMDCTEQPIERPIRKQKKYYSGKKKRHTMKTQVQISESGQIVSVSKSFPGSTHDFEVYKQGSPVAANSTVYVDSGYQGLDKLHKATVLPFKKPKKGSLSKDEKKHNTTLSKRRVAVENKIREIKIFRIISGKYRNKRRGYGLKFNIVAGLVNMKKGF